MAVATVITTGLLYVLPKGLTYMCTRIEDPVSRIDRLRDLMGRVQEAVQNALGPNGWFFVTDMLADNGWLAFFVFAYATKWKWQTVVLTNPILSLWAFLALVGGSETVRFCLGNAHPPLRPYIGTRSEAGYDH